MQDSACTIYLLYYLSSANKPIFNNKRYKERQTAALDWGIQKVTVEYIGICIW